MSQDLDLKTYANQVIRPFLEKVGLILDKGPEVRKILFSVEHIHIQEFLVFMMDILITRKALRGILVSVDRPFNYIDKLMKVKGINVERLTVVDIMTALVGGTPKVPDNVVVLRSPFCDGLHIDLVDLLQGNSDQTNIKIDLAKNHFLMFDNIAVLDHYIEMMHLKKLFVKLEQTLKDHPHIKHILILDKDRQQKVYSAFDGWADIEVPLKLD